MAVLYACEVRPILTLGSDDRNPLSRRLSSMTLSLAGLILLFALDAVATFLGILSDPGKIPHLLAYLSIAGAAALLFSNLWEYFFRPVAADWRLGLLRFGLLYFCLIAGFASTYYLIKKDFTIPKEPDPELDAACKVLEDQISKLEAKIKKLKAEILRRSPAGLERAKKEYDTRNFLEDLRKRETMLFSLRESAPWPLSDYLPMIDPQKVSSQLEKLDQNIISQYQEYLRDSSKLEEAERDLANTRSQERAEIGKYSYFNFVYFSTVTVATVGYGDISPKTLRARQLVTLEIVLGGALVLVYLTLVLGKR
jgi:hypothetical protein